MAAGPTAPDLLAAFTAAVVEADALDPASLRELGRALERARQAGALSGALAQEAEGLARALQANSGAAEALARVGELVADEGQRPPGTPAAPAAAAAHRDPETIELIGDFLEESGEGLARADEMLLSVERDGPEPDKVHALFRVFHTIKGVAGFLELGEIVSLSHTTENLLNLVRDGRMELKGDVFEAVFEATAVLRRLLGRLRAAVDARLELQTDPGVPPLVARISAVAVRAESPEPAAAPPTPPARGAAPRVEASQEPVRTASAEPAGPAPAEAPPPEQAAPPAPALAAAMPEYVVRPAPAKPTGAAEAGGGSQLRETVKVDLERVDSMVEMIGELIIVEAMVVHAPELQRIASLKLRNYLNQLTKISRDLQNVAMRMRMVPVRNVFQKMARLVRDLSRKTGKDVVLELDGEDTEMDRSMVERIEDPLVHLVRNALDHGIEPSAERVKAGKPARSTLRLAAYHEGGSIVVELADDGRGLNRDRILAKAREKGLVAENQELSDPEVQALIFLPGFSTAAKVTEISGRGVGMDVVKRNVEGMRGRVTVSSLIGQGTAFRMVLPLTLAIIEGMLVMCGSEKYIIPSLCIIESLRPTEDMIFSAAARGEVINVRGEILPLLRLHRLLEMAGAERLLTESHVVVVEGMGRKVGLVLDDVLTQQQVVIKPLGTGMGDTDFLSGAAILSDGRVGLILNVDRLAQLATRAGRVQAVAAGA
ncbi:MAG TPA: chemotaxis protein CheA [Anaeromyxobacter sp.]|nr:chemotaxis protein CheA [Anaeromyxobacter sp.]